MSPQEAHRLVGHDLSATEPQPCPTRRSRVVARVVLFVVILGACVGFCGARYARAAEVQPERVWVVVNLTTGTPYRSPRGYPATATNPTACDLAMSEAVRFVPAGTRLACRKISNK